MSRVTFSVIILLSLIAAAGCNSQKTDTHDTVIIESDDDNPGNNILSGDYECRDDGSTLKITEAEGGRYDISLGLFRLMEIDDGIGKLEDGNIVFSGTDASGNRISGKITINGDTARTVFIHSTWEYIPNGTTYTFERKHALPAESGKSYSTAGGMSMRIVKPQIIKAPLDSLVVEFRNARRDEGLTGEWFRIERQTADGNWLELPFDRELENSDGEIAIVFNDVGYIISPDATLQMTVKPWFYEKKWVPGTYRLAKTFSYPPYPRTTPSDTAYVEFQIK